MKPDIATEAGLDVIVSGRHHKPRLLFGRMHEDSSIECSLFPPGAKVFCFASAGCTAMALAAQGRPVDAVDVNPEQVAYVKRRLAGEAVQDGVVEHMLRRARNAIGRLGPDRDAIRSFLLLENPCEQVHIWQQDFDHALTPRLFDLALSRFVLGVFYRPGFLPSVPALFGETMRKRIIRGLGAHPNSSNPYFWRLLCGCDPPGFAPHAPITIAPRVICADVAEYLEAAAPRSYDAFSLSNIFDGATPQYQVRVRAAISKAAKPGAVVIVRSLLEPENETQDRLAALDRSMLWGRIQIDRIRPGEWR